MSENQGWIKIHRKIQEKGWWNNSKYVHLWLHLLLSANHKPKEFMWNNQIIVVKEGQLITGRKELAKKTGLSESSVERILKCFENEQQIEQQKTTKFRLINIINWVEYQNVDNKMDNKRTTNEQQTDTNKNVKNDKNEKNIILHSEPSSQIKSIMDIFYKTNPTLNWGNKTYRKSIEEMIKLWGLEKTTRMAEFAVSIQGQPFSPTITNPYHLKLKATELGIYWKKNQPKSTLTIAE